MAEQRFEYRVIWQRKGKTQKVHRVYQTLKAAIACAERQKTAHEDMTWLDEPPPPLIYGPVIEERQVGPWAPQREVAPEELRG